jgi:hypothetical protein
MCVLRNLLKIDYEFEMKNQNHNSLLVAAAIENMGLS